MDRVRLPWPVCARLFCELKKPDVDIRQKRFPLCELRLPALPLRIYRYLGLPTAHLPTAQSSSFTVESPDLDRTSSAGAGGGGGECGAAQEGKKGLSGSLAASPSVAVSLLPDIQYKLSLLISGKLSHTHALTIHHIYISALAQYDSSCVHRHLDESDRMHSDPSPSHLTASCGG